MERHYGMDWLRIGAFGLLIFYHIGMVFVPWGFQLKTQTPMIWTEIPMFLTSPWRLTLLFVVSGYASRALFTKSAGPGAFLRNRSARLLVPLAFGMAVIVPPQTWVELTTQHGYTHGFGYFLLHDYFRFGALDGIIMPTWNHLWFVVYLWVYTLGLRLAMLVPGVERAQALFDRAFAGWRALAIPALYFVLLEAFAFRHHTEDSHDLFFDGVAHLRYVPAFLFGFGLAGSRPVMTSLARHWKAAAALAITSYATLAGLLIAYPDFSFPSHAVTQAYLVARHLETWTAIAALIGIAELYWNRDTAWRAMFAEATFPFYIIHQTTIVVVGYWLVRAGTGAGVQFPVLVVATIASCWAFYLGGREVNWLRPLIGLKRRGAAIATRPHWTLSDRAQPDLA
jgi:hypothetical protein